jgi:two-component system LytT family response regulator
MGIKTLIIEDEPLARRRISSLLSSDAEIDLLGECSDGTSALQQIEASKPELIFLDIQMPGLDGFTVLHSIKINKPAVIFVTAFDHHAVRAFESEALDFLLKPFKRSRFEASVTRAKRYLAMSRDFQPHSRHIQETVGGRIAFRSSGKIMVFDSGEIDWIEACANYVRVQVGGAHYDVRESITTFENKLPSARFLRIHRSFIVNLDRVNMLEPCNGSEYIVTLRSGKHLPLGRTYRQSIRELLHLDE